MTNRNVIVMTSHYAAHARHSGYGALARHLQPETEVVSECRRDPRTLIDRIRTWVITRSSFCAWYRLSSWKMERRVLHLLKAKRNAVIHVFWADLDLGYLDLLTKRRNNPICATFHSCDDTLRDNMRFPSRVRT